MYGLADVVVSSWLFWTFLKTINNSHNNTPKVLDYCIYLASVFSGYFPGCPNFWRSGNGYSLATTSSSEVELVSVCYFLFALSSRYSVLFHLPGCIAPGWSAVMSDSLSTIASACIYIPRTYSDVRVCYKNPVLYRQEVFSIDCKICLFPFFWSRLQYHCISLAGPQKSINMYITSWLF